ncbi:MAG: hypothetical protein K8R53_10965, partial [Bacteroidales bacterium]|nr:hypothetical protein [Bacteroidales bacterium]
MLKPLLFLLIVNTINITYAIEPDFSLEASGSITDFVIDGKLIYVATNKGVVEIFSLETWKPVKLINIPFIKDFTSELIPAKIFSIDKIDETLLMAVQGSQGFTDVYSYSAIGLQKIIDSGKDKLMILEARYIDENQILLALLSNELILMKI